MTKLQVQRRLLAASGFVELSMFQESVEELESLPPELREMPIVLAVWLEVYQGWQKWTEALAVATRLTVAEPDTPNWQVALAYATRRTRGILLAREILIAAGEKFPDCATIQFNLGCYAAQFGDLDEARLRVESAIRLDRQFETLANSDLDLAPLRNHSRGDCKK
jgi:lipopolysaccharide biosynthesis regulator YciM